MKTYLKYILKQLFEIKNVVGCLNYFLYDFFFLSNLEIPNFIEYKLSQGKMIIIFYTYIFLVFKNCLLM